MLLPQAQSDPSPFRAAKAVALAVMVTKPVPVGALEPPVAELPQATRLPSAFRATMLSLLVKIWL